MSKPEFLSDTTIHSIREQLSAEFGLDVNLEFNDTQYSITIPKDSSEVNAKLRELSARLTQLLSKARKDAFFNANCFVYILFTDCYGVKGAYRDAEHQLLSDAAVKERALANFNAFLRSQIVSFSLSYKVWVRNKSLRSVVVDAVKVARSLEEADAIDISNGKAGYI